MNPPDGITSAAAALRYWERRQEMLANNLANSDTSGFKAERVFARLLASGVTAPDSATDLRPGQLTPTGNTLDIALDGAGFLVVDTPRGERLSRGGALRLDAGGFITDQSGRRLLGERGPVRVAGGTIAVDRTGAVSVDGREVDRLRVEVAPAGTVLQHDAGTLFVPGATRTAVPLAERGVKQGFVEESNVSTIGTMVDMISVQRAYAAVEKAVVALDGIHGTISNDLAKSS